MKTVAATFALALVAFTVQAQAPCTVNVNAATVAELQYLHRVGPVLSERIVAARPLDAAKLDGVKGVGETWLTDNGPHVRFSGATTCAAKLVYPACTSEDASSGPSPCVWNCKTMGNKECGPGPQKRIIRKD